MVVKPLSQRDPRWANKKLGFSNYTIGSHGCTITSLTMLLNYLGYAETPDTVNNTLKTLGNYDRLKNPKGAFQNALLVWANIQRVYPKLKFVWRGLNYDNVKVAWYVYVKSLPVMVEVNAAKIGAPRHWVLFKGGRIANDPWTGKEIATNYYPLTGYGLYDRA